MKRNETQRGYALIGVLGITVLKLLMLVSIAGAAPFAYITNLNSNTVSVVDTATNSVIATVQVGKKSVGNSKRSNEKSNVRSFHSKIDLKIRN